MKFFNILLCICFINFNNLRANEVIISLGRDCEVAGQIHRNGLRKEAFPFDWIQTFNFDGLIKLLAEDFINFLNTKHLILGVDKISIKNSRYDIGFVHDFPTKETPQIQMDSEIMASLIIPNYIDYLPIVLEKYTRRINRFNEVLQSKNKVFFIRTHISPQQSKMLAEFFEKKYKGKLEFTVIAVHNDPNFNYDWKIRRVKNFYVSQLYPNHPTWWSDPEWKRVFYSLGLIDSKKQYFSKCY